MIIYKNLLAEDDDVFGYGILLENEKVFCLCGCGTFFEKGEYAIISKSVDKASNIPYQKMLERCKNVFSDKLEKYRREIVAYGYSWEGMYGITPKIGKLLFQYNVETYRLYEDGTEGAIDNISEFDSHGGWFGVEKKTLETAIENGILDNFFFEDWNDGVHPTKMQFSDYVICMDSKYVRDSQMLNTKEMTDKEFEEIDWQSCELESYWYDMEPSPFIAVVRALDEEKALSLAAEKYRYDRRCLYVAKTITRRGCDEKL